MITGPHRVRQELNNVLDLGSSCRASKLTSKSYEGPPGAQSKYLVLGNVPGPALFTTFVQKWPMTARVHGRGFA